MITDLSIVDLLLSGVFLWTIGLFVPVVIRFLIARMPLSKGAAFAVVAIQWMANLAVIVALGSRSRTHAALFLVALVSYRILIAGESRKQQPFSWTTMALILSGFLVIPPLLAVLILAFSS